MARGAFALKSIKLEPGAGAAGVLVGAACVGLAMGSTGSTGDTRDVGDTSNTGDTMGTGDTMSFGVLGTPGECDAGFGDTRIWGQCDKGCWGHQDMGTV